MRALFTTTGSAGHLGPLVPFADAILRAGGEVLIATRASSAMRARAAGFDVWPFPEPPAEKRNAVMASVRGLPLEEAHARLLKEVFGGMDARAALPDVLEACSAWGPDLVVYEPSELAGRVAAAHRGLPSARVSITQFAVEHRRQQEMDEALERLRAGHGLNGRNGAHEAHWTLMPPLLEHPSAPGPANMERFREPDATPSAPLADFWYGAADPLVYVTFGSVAGQRDDVFPALYRSTIDAVAPLPIRVLVTIGRDRDPRDLGPVPANVHVERWVPQASVMPHARAMVSHGGSGTLRAGLAAGIPQVVLPLFADQPDNAERVDALGAGIALDPHAGGVADAVHAVLTEPRYAAQAAQVAAEMLALPDVDVAVARLSAQIIR